MVASPASGEVQAAFTARVERADQLVERRRGDGVAHDGAYILRLVVRLAVLSEVAAHILIGDVASGGQPRPFVGVLFLGLFVPGP